jgi:TRAP-type C4-dicarboxylate transport system permease small subunit
MTGGETQAIPSAFRRRLASFGDLLAQLCLIVAAVCLFAIIAINGANVVFRYVLSAAWSWAEEAMLFLMVLMVFAGAVAASWRGAHLALDMLLERLPVALRRAAILAMALFSVAVLAVLAASSFKVVSLLYRFGQKSAALEFPMWIAQGCVCAGFVLIALMIVLRLLTVGPVMLKTELQSFSEQGLAGQ